MASGRPLLYVGGERGEIARIIREHGMGQVIEPGDREALEGAVVEYASDSDRTAREGAMAYTAHETAFAMHRALECYRAVFARCVLSKTHDRG
jgi:hypothetical protein